MTLIATRVLIYDAKNTHVESVVYFRGNMNIDFALRWKWYFEYLAALVKVNNPKRKVDLYFGNQDVKIGDDWIKSRTENLLRHRRNKLKSLSNRKIDIDLFGFGEMDRKADISKTQEEIQQLENGNFPIPEFPEYVNNLKDYVQIFHPLKHPREARSGVVTPL